MEKRLPLFLFLSFLILFGWSILFPPVASDNVTVDDVPGGPPGVPVVTAPTIDYTPDVAGTEERELVLVVGEPSPPGEDVRPGHYRVLVSNRGARLVELDFGDYFTVLGLDEPQRRDKQFWLPLVRSIQTPTGPTGSLLIETSPSSEVFAPLGLANVLWEMKELEAPQRGVEFRYGRSDGILFTKRISTVPGKWHLRLEFEITNGGQDRGGPTEFLLTPAGVVPPELGDRFYPEPRAAVVGYDKDDDEYVLEWESAAGADDGGDTLDAPTPLTFAGAHNKYFAFLLRSADVDDFTLAGARYAPVERVVQPGEQLSDAELSFEYIRTDVSLAAIVPGPGETNTYTYTVYAGPKDRSALIEDHEAHAALLDEDLGFFDTIGRGLLAVLGFFHGVTGNWGVAIILLTLCVRSALFPLNRRSQTSMARYQKKMKRVQPKLNESKERYANDPQKQREAQARIMQEEGAFPPLGGCLPIFVQIPVFFGLFSALRTSFDLRQAPFYGWIDDLSRPDRLLELDMQIPLLITTFDLSYLNLLPILMVVLWIWQQKGMPQPTDDQAKRMQKMMMFMPIVFGFMLYNYAAGLSLYMMTQSTLGIIEQKVIKKLWPIDDTEVAKKDGKKSGCGPFSGLMENLAEKQREQMKQMQAVQNQKGSQSKKQKRKKR